MINIVITTFYFHTIIAYVLFESIGLADWELKVHGSIFKISLDLIVSNNLDTITFEY